MLNNFSDLLSYYFIIIIIIIIITTVYINYKQDYNNVVSITKLREKNT